ncbi:hypothetical protein ccbrp13_59590 [Ktedonobacteria bacterium brp13]|nr:hypothetical protein ccbrp13_59590 [Ktedonobacteria bacterium brp13]
MVALKLSVRDDFWRSYTPATLALSPDGHYLAFIVRSRASESVSEQPGLSVQRAGSRERGRLYLLALGARDVVSAMGTFEPQLLTEDVHVGSVLAWHPDSRHLLFAHAIDGMDAAGNEASKQSVLSSISLEDKHIQHLLAAEYVVHEAAWSPDGMRIALLGTHTSHTSSSATDTLQSSVDQLYLLSLSSQSTVDDMVVSSPHCLTHSSSAYRQLSWTPDGYEVAVLGHAEQSRSGEPVPAEVMDLLMFHAETGIERCLTEHDLDIATYAWAPDSQSAVVVGMRQHVQDQQGQQSRQLFLVTRYGNVGDHTLAISPSLEGEVFAVSQADEKTAVLPGPYRPQWDETGQRLYFLVSEYEGHNALHCLEIVWRSQTRLTEPTALLTFIALIPGQAQLLLTEVSSAGDVGLYHVPLAE